MGKKHKPNFIPLKFRVLSGVGAVYLLLFTVAVLAMGHVFLPGKYGRGILLSGIPTLMIVFASLAVCLIAILTIIDHYDKRPNEHKYESIKITCIKIAAVLYLGAPFVEILEMILVHNNIHLLPKFHGFAENYTFYSPDLQKYAPYIEPLTNSAGWLFLAFFVLTLSGIGINKYYPTVSKRIVVVLTGLGMFCMSAAILFFSFEDFLSGQTTDDDLVYKALEEPAKFNAVLLTNFVIGAFMMLASLYAVVAIITNRIKIPAKD